MSDISFIPKEEYDEFVRDVGEYHAPITTYRLSAGGENALVGRIALQQFADLVRYFFEVLELLNAAEEESTGVSKIARPSA